MSDPLDAATLATTYSDGTKRIVTMRYETIEHRIIDDVSGVEESRVSHPEHESNGCDICEDGDG